MCRGDLLETECPVCSRRFSHDSVTRPSFMRDGKLFVDTLSLGGSARQVCDEPLAHGPGVLCAGGPGVSRRPPRHTRVTHHWRVSGGAQFVSYYPIGKCLFRPMNSFIGLNVNNAVKEREK